MVPLSKCIQNVSIFHCLYHDFSGQASNRPSLNECKGLLLLLPTFSKDFTDICQGIIRLYNQSVSQLEYFSFPGKGMCHCEMR